MLPHCSHVKPDGAGGSINDSKTIFEKKTKKQTIGLHSFNWKRRQWTQCFIYTQPNRNQCVFLVDFRFSYNHHCRWVRDRSMPHRVHPLPVANCHTVAVWCPPRPTDFFKFFFVLARFSVGRYHKDARCDRRRSALSPLFQLCHAGIGLLLNQLLLPTGGHRLRAIGLVGRLAAGRRRQVRCRVATSKAAATVATRIVIVVVVVVGSGGGWHVGQHESEIGQRHVVGVDTGGCNARIERFHLNGTGTSIHACEEITLWFFLCVCWKNNLLSLFLCRRLHWPDSALQKNQTKNQSTQDNKPAVWRWDSVS